MGIKRYFPTDGKTWIKNSISIWSDINKTIEEKRLKHPALFPEALIDRLIEIFYNEYGLENNGTVLDPFCGSGTVLLSAYKKGLHSIGFELNEEYIKLSENRFDMVEDHKIYQPVIYNEDSRNIATYITPDSINLCITSPPYWDVLKQKRTADKKVIQNYGDDERDLGTINNYNSFLDELDTIFNQVYLVLKLNGYCIVNVMDLRKKSNFYPLHMDLTERMLGIGFILDDIIVWDRRKDYNNLGPLGYPNVFRVNKVHEYLMIFIKKS